MQAATQSIANLLQVNTDTATNPKGPPNVNLPTFLGKPEENVTMFIYQLELIFNSHKVSANDQVSYSIGALKGNILIWAQNHCSLTGANFPNYIMLGFCPAWVTRAPTADHVTRQ